MTLHRYFTALANRPARGGACMLPWGVLAGLVSIIVIDLLLCSDNALVIAIAVRALPQQQRRMALLAGAGLAVLIRIAVTFGASKLLEVAFLQLAGGAFVIWIALKVFRDAQEAEQTAPSPHDIRRAIGSIVIADLTMSTDNILAIAGASKGNLALIIFGLALSIPLVVTSSTVVAIMMDKYPITLYIGAAVLGRVGGEMILTDSFVRNLFHPSAPLRDTIEGVLIAVILLAGWLLRRRPS